MEKFRIGDKIKVIHKGKVEHTCTVLEILEDYSGNSYWIRDGNGRLILEIETPETIFEKVY